MDLFAPAEATAAPPLRDRDQIPDRFKWNLTSIFETGTRWHRGYEELDGKIAAFAALQGTLADGPAALLDGAEAPGRDRAARVQGAGTSRRCGTTRISATTRSTPGASRSRSCSPRRRRPRPGSIPSCCRFRSRRSSSGWRRCRRSPSTGSPSRTCTASRSTCSTTRASACCRCRAASPRRRTTPTRRSRRRTSSIRSSDLSDGVGGHADLRAVPRDSRDQPEPGRPRRRVPRVSHGLRAVRQHLRVALQRRAAARLVPLAGARLRARRSMPRCTATTFRRRWSRT